MADRILPHSIEAENALLGCLIVDPGLMIEIADDLSPEDFYSPNNQAVFAGLTALHLADNAIDMTTLPEMLKRSGDFDKIGGMPYLYNLVGAAPLEHNVKEYSEIIKDNALTRELIRTASEIIDSAYQEHESAKDLIESAEQKIFNLSQGRTEGSGLVPIREVVFDTLTKIQEINANRGKLTGIGTGFTELDQKTSGLQKSDLIIIAARPSMGKTALAMNIAAHAALREKKSVLIFSLEMSREQLVQRMILSEALVNGNKVRTGDLGMEEWAPITASAELLAETHVTINDTPGLSLTELRSICRRKRIEEPIDLIIIDYMQLMTGSGRRSENRQNEISEISRGLKQVAREMECPVICLSQLARGPEARIDKRPLLSDLRDSGSIEQDADVVMFLYRDSYYNKEEAANPFEAELNIAKQRNGPTGRIDLRWLADYTKFMDPAEPGLDEEAPPF